MNLKVNNFRLKEYFLSFHSNCDSERFIMYRYTVEQRIAVIKLILESQWPIIARGISLGIKTKRNLFVRD